jgi:hypothetical protein
MPPDNDFFQGMEIGELKTFFGGHFYFPYMMGLGQGHRVASPLWVQLNVVLVNAFKQLNLSAFIQDTITVEMIHSMAVLFVDDINLYTWREYILDPGEL